MGQYKKLTEQLGLWRLVALDYEAWERYSRAYYNLPVELQEKVNDVVWKRYQDKEKELNG